MKKRECIIEVVKSHLEKGKWFTRTIGKNGETLQHSEMLNSKQSAIKNAKAVLQASKIVVVE